MWNHINGNKYTVRLISYYKIGNTVSIDIGAYYFIVKK